MEKKIVLCDTDILIEFYRGNASVRDQLMLIGMENIRVSIITVGELLYGVYNREALQRLEKDLAQLDKLNINQTVGNVFLGLMEQYCLSHRLAVPDGLIASTAITYNIPLYTNNIKDFRFIDDLELYKPQ